MNLGQIETFSLIHSSSVTLMAPLILNNFPQLTWQSGCGGQGQGSAGQGPPTASAVCGCLVSNRSHGTPTHSVEGHRFHFICKEMQEDEGYT